MFHLIFHSDLGDEHVDVRRELIPVAAKWRNIGSCLGLKPDTLDSIDKRNSGNPTACLMSVVTEWLKRNYNMEKFGEPTWQQLVRAVADPAGGANKGVAKDMATKHKAGGISMIYIFS